MTDPAETPDLYAELDIPREATGPEITRAYRKRSMKTHPDAGGTAEAFAATKLAYDILSDPDKREAYDETGAISKGPNDQQILENAIGILDILFDGMVDDEAPDPDQFDPLRLLKLHLQQNVAEAAEKISRLERKLKKIRRLQQRIVARTNVEAGKSQIGRILKQRARTVLNAIEQRRFEESALRRAILIIDEHWMPDETRAGAGFFQISHV